MDKRQRERLKAAFEDGCLPGQTIIHLEDGSDVLRDEHWSDPPVWHEHPLQWFLQRGWLVFVMVFLGGMVLAGGFFLGEWLFGSPW